MTYFGSLGAYCLEQYPEVLIQVGNNDAPPPDALTVSREAQADGREGQRLS